MIVCVVGWYGTETLGDRAILDGIFRIFEKIEKNNEFLIGSLYPILTERTINEDMQLYRMYSGFNVSTFDVQNSKDLDSAIRKSNIVVMGGGPLMDLRAMNIIKYAFTKAKKYNKCTGLVGCGFGPLNDTKYILIAKELLEMTDFSILRSKRCCENAKTLVSEKNITYGVDPAILSVLAYKKIIGKMKKSDFSIANIRDIDYVYGTKNKYYNWICEYISRCAEAEETLYLVPMHSFSVGGDDRLFQNKVRFDIEKENVVVIQKPYSLLDMYEITSRARHCFGMRYHSIVFQTLLNGNNYISNYTDSKNGKINAFLDDINGKVFYMSGRYISYDSMENSFDINDEEFVPESLDLDEMLSNYTSIIKMSMGRSYNEYKDI